MRTRTMVALAAAGVSLLTAQAASAAVITETVYDPSATTYTTTTFGIVPNTGTAGVSGGIPSDTLHFAGFDATFGRGYESQTLNYVILEITNSLKVTGSVLNTSTSSAETITLNIDNIVSFNLNGALSGQFNGGLPNGEPVVGSLTQEFTNVPAATTSIVNGSQVTINGSTDVGTIVNSYSVLTQILSGPTSLYDVSYTGSTGDLGFASATCSSSDCATSVTDSGQIAVTANYFYTPGAVPPPVPEPASMAILASSLLAMGMLRRHRRG